MMNCSLRFDVTWALSGTVGTCIELRGACAQGDLLEEVALQHCEGGHHPGLAVCGIPMQL